MKNDQTNASEPLPMMRTVEDAIALCRERSDNYFLTAFMLEAWLGRLAIDYGAEYGEKKNASERSVQGGRGWKRFQETFRNLSAAELGQVFSNMLRFSEHSNPLSEILCRAILPLGIEHECTGDFVGPKQMEVLNCPSDAIVILRRTVERWCEWVDAVLHWNAHQLHHLAPLTSDPDPEKRELAVLGVNQRHLAEMSAHSQEHWHWHHGEAAERFKGSPKWPALGKAMSSEAMRPWNYPDLDALLISLWPLVKRHNWTYRDLMAVARQVMPPPYPKLLEREQDLAAYCANVLGLRKPDGPQGKSSADGQPQGYEVALRLCSRKPQSNSS